MTMASVRAKIDNSGTKPLLVVDGEIMVYASDHSITAHARIPQGFNPAIFLVIVQVVERPSPMKGVMRPFHLTQPLGTTPYTEVQVDFEYEPEAEPGSRIETISCTVEDCT